MKYMIIIQVCFLICDAHKPISLAILLFLSFTCEQVWMCITQQLTLSVGCILRPSVGQISLLITPKCSYHKGRISDLQTNPILLLQVDK